MSAIGDTGAPRHTGGGPETGFTLIEVLVAIAVAALVAGILFPRVEQSLGYWRFRASLTAVEAVLRDARARALRLGDPTRVGIDAATRSFALQGAPAVALEPGVRFADGSAAIDFYGDGSSSGGRITLSGPSGRQATLQVSPDTGLAGTLR